MTSDRPSPAARLRSVAWACLVGIFVLAPFVTTNLTGFGIGTLPFTHDQIELPRVLFVHLLAWFALGAWGLSSVLDRGARARVHVALSALGFFLFVALVASIASPFKFTAFFGDYRHYEGFFTLVLYAVVAFLAMQLANAKRIEWLARLAVLAAGLLSLYGIAQTVKLDRASWLTDILPGRAFSTWGNPDFFGGYLIIPIALAVAVLFGDSDKRWRIVGGVSGALSFAALVATATRGAWLAGGVAILIMVVALIRKGFPWKLLTAATAGLVVASGVAFNIASKGELLTRILTAFTAGEAGLGIQRVEIWKNMLNLAGASPLLGYGPDAVAAASAARFGGYLIGNDAHNLPLQLTLSVGIFGAIALYVFFVWSGVASAKAAFATSRGTGALVLSGMWAGVAGYLVHLLIGVSMVTSTAMMYACLGVLLGAVAKKSFDVPRAAGIAITAVAGVLLVATAYFGVRGLAADRAYLETRKARREGADRLTPAQRAVQLNPFNATYLRELQSARNAEGK